MTTQIKNEFDIQTIKKIAKSALISLAAVAGAFLVAYSQGVPFAEALKIAIGALGGLLITIPKEFVSGEIKKSEVSN